MPIPLTTAADKLLSQSQLRVQVPPLAKVLPDLPLQLQPPPPPDDGDGRREHDGDGVGAVRVGRDLSVRDGDGVEVYVVVVVIVVVLVVIDVADHVADGAEDGHHGPQEHHLNGGIGRFTSAQVDLENQPILSQ